MQRKNKARLAHVIDSAELSAQIKYSSNFTLCPDPLCRRSSALIQHDRSINVAKLLPRYSKTESERRRERETAVKRQFPAHNCIPSADDTDCTRWRGGSRVVLCRWSVHFIFVTKLQFCRATSTAGPGAPVRRYHLPRAINFIWNH